MIYIHIIVLIFFIVIIMYSLYKNKDTIEPLDNCSLDDPLDDPLIKAKTNANDIDKINSEMNEFKGIKSRLNVIEQDANSTYNVVHEMATKKE